MYKLVIKYGILAGIALAGTSVLSILIWGIDYDMDLTGTLIGIVFASIVVFWGIKTYRDKILNGAIAFGKALQIGIYISIVSAVIFTAYDYTIYKLFFPDYTMKFMEFHKEKIKNSGDSPDIIQKRLQKLEEQRDFINNDLIQSFFMFSIVFTTGSVVSLIFSFLIKKRGVTSAV